MTLLTGLAVWCSFLMYQLTSSHTSLHCLQGWCKEMGKSISKNENRVYLGGQSCSILKHSKLGRHPWWIAPLPFVFGNFLGGGLSVGLTLFSLLNVFPLLFWLITDPSFLPLYIPWRRKWHYAKWGAVLVKINNKYWNKLWSFIDVLLWTCL